MNIVPTTHRSPEQARQEFDELKLNPSVLCLILGAPSVIPPAVAIDVLTAAIKTQLAADVIWIQDPARFLSRPEQAMWWLRDQPGLVVLAPDRTVVARFPPDGITQLGAYKAVASAGAQAAYGAEGRVNLPPTQGKTRRRAKASL